MMTTPLLMKGIDKLLSRRLNPADDTGEAPWVEDDKPQVIIVGFGRFGQVIGRLLMANKMRYYGTGAGHQRGRSDAQLWL